jgi:hypothetical protein
MRAAATSFPALPLTGNAAEAYTQQNRPTSQECICTLLSRLLHLALVLSLC